ncbi:centrosomal protein of 290 kDa-like [Apis dorsata]|uniref:centrosomal protein of 290 kDa-like n=1 Tax=Apis dorsata TaxID=7462 RepID=UPI0012935A69|nr:centrosomal protein of 290 kDa-like [Apis dorsata]
MADDPNRDLLPVREGSCTDTFSSIDPRDRHCVIKLDRYQLEDRYLRLLEEANNLKKLTNCQEDKIKRLATKLMRVTASTRPCSLALNIYEDKNKIIALELENSKLKDKITVLKNQLLSHTISSRSSSKTRVRPSSGRITCRSESSRTKLCCHCLDDDTSNVQSYLEKIEELESQKSEMCSRIIQLEKEVATYTTICQREKVADNVEYIKIWREMKQINDKLITAENENGSLTAQIDDLKKKLDEKTKKNEIMASELLLEKKRIAEIDEQILKTKDSELSLREKNEQIKDLLKEVKILQQHNEELIILNSKYTKVEIENKELKKKVIDQQHDQETLKTAVDNEQANIIALQTSNEQLLGKLEELQKNIENLTSYQTQAEKAEAKDAQISICFSDMQISALPTKHDLMCKNIEAQIKCRKCSELEYEEVNAVKKEKCKKCCEPIDNEDLHKNMLYNSRIKTVENKSMQTEIVKTTVVDGKDYNEIVASKKEILIKEVINSESQTLCSESMKRAMITDSQCYSLSPDKMLKFLEEAQIGTTCPEAIKQRSTATDIDYDILDQYQRQSSTEKKAKQETFELKLQHQSRKDKIIPLEKQSADPNKLISVLFNILQEYSLTCTIPKEASTLYRPAKRAKFPNIDNDVKTTVYNDDVSSIPSSKKICCSPYKQEKIRKKISNTKKRHRIKMINNTCTCTNLKYDGKCTHCCNTLVKSLQNDVSPYESWNKNEKKNGENPKNISMNSPASLQDYVKHLDKYKEFMTEMNEIAESVQAMDPIQNFLQREHKSESETHCSLECPNIDCIDISNNDSFPLVIGEGQGLVELHIVSLQLSTSAKQILFQEKDLGNVSLYVSWNIWNQETAYTPTLKCPKLNFNSSFVYRIPDLFSFFNYILLEFVIFQVNVYQEDNKNFIVARGKLCIKDILDYPQNKLHYIAPVNSVIPCTVGMNFGQLSLWVRLSCDLEKVEAFKKRRGIVSDVEKPKKELESKVVPKVVPKEEIVPKVVITEPKEETTPEEDPEVQYESNDSDEVQSIVLEKLPDLEENLTVMKETDEETNASIKDVLLNNMLFKWRTESNEETTNEEENNFNERFVPKERLDPDLFFKELEKENDIDVNEEKSNDTIKEVADVIVEKNWNKYKERSLRTAKDSVKIQEPVIDESNDNEIEKDVIIIEIINMHLFSTSYVMQNPDYELFYIEYCFLGYCGADMETISVRKPSYPNKFFEFNFKKLFRISEDKYSVQSDILRAMLDNTTNPNIRFIVVCEPLPEETDMKECVEIGYANFNIREYALGEAKKYNSLPIYGVEEHEEIGILKEANYS